MALKIQTAWGMNKDVVPYIEYWMLSKAHSENKMEWTCEQKESLYQLNG